MNLILLDPQLERENSEAILEFSGARAKHLIAVLNVTVGDRLRIGRIDDGTSEVEVLEVGTDFVRTRICEDWKPQVKPQAPRLVMALPRPKVFRRMLRHAVILGFKQIHFCHSYRVEKSYWSSPLISPAIIEKDVRHGLELAQDVFLPEVQFHRFFKPFAEDVLSTWISKDKISICAHPHAVAWQPGSEPVSLLAIGPEGGWIEYELKLFEELGVKTKSFTDRTLSCETALPFIAGQLL